MAGGGIDSFEGSDPGSAAWRNERKEAFLGLDEAAARGLAAELGLAPSFCRLRPEDEFYIHTDDLVPGRFVLTLNTAGIVIDVS